MDSRPGRELYRSGRLFFGRVTAGQTHDISNVLNIINEYSGLLRDLVTAAEQGRAADPARFHQLADKIRVQVERGEGLCRHLNRFAHSVDVAVAVIDLREMLARVAAIAERPARLKRVRLDVEEPPQAITIESDVFDVQHVMFACVELALDAATERREVKMACSSGPEGVVFSVTSADPWAATEPTRARLLEIERLLEALGGRLLVAPDGAAERCVRCVLATHSCERA